GAESARTLDPTRPSARKKHEWQEATSRKQRLCLHRGFDPGCFAPYIAAHEWLISPRNFFQVAPPPRGMAASRPLARSRLTFSSRRRVRGTFSDKLSRIRPGAPLQRTAIKDST